MPWSKKRRCDDSNTRHLVSSKIRVLTGLMAEGSGLVTGVTAPGVFVLGGHTPVIKIPGNAIALAHVLQVAEG